MVKAGVRRGTSRSIVYKLVLRHVQIILLNPHAARLWTSGNEEGMPVIHERLEAIVHDHPGSAASPGPLPHA